MHVMVNNGAYQTLHGCLINRSGGVASVLLMLGQLLLRLLHNTQD